MNFLTRQNIAQALWMKEYDPAKIPAHILQRIESEQNSERAYADRFLYRLKQLEASPLTFVPERKERYAFLRRHWEQTRAMSPRQFYASCLFLGPESLVGYQTLPLDPIFTHPAIDLPQLQHQLGWHFFVGNLTDAEGNHYSVELMFWQYALLPPALAAELGLSDIDNQSLELHLAICDPQSGQQYRANTVVVAGTTGLVEVQSKPYAYRIGRNAIEGLNPNGDLFPAHLQARGWDMGKPGDVEFDIDITLDNPKGFFLQGEDGCSPSVDGLGTLYYSASLLKLRPGVESAITIAGKRIVLTGGSMWYDHQWTAGFMPAGAAGHEVMRAASNLTPAQPGGWDWFEVQFHAGVAEQPQQEVQMTLSSLHSTANQDYYWQTGPTPPGPMTADIRGKYIDGDNRVTDIRGTMTVTSWVKNNTTPNPEVYPPTNTWYPAGYHFKMDQALLGRLKEFTLEPLIASGQTGFFGNGLQYTEGGAIARDLAGVEIGRGFAEGTNWAHTTDTVVTAGGLPVSEESRELLKRKAPSVDLCIASGVFAAIHKNQLDEIMESARGL